MGRGSPGAVTPPVSQAGCSPPCLARGQAVRVLPGLTAAVTGRLRVPSPPALPPLETLSPCDFSGLRFTRLPFFLLLPEPPKGKDHVSLIFVSWCVAHWGLWQRQRWDGVGIHKTQCSVVPKNRFREKHGLRGALGEGFGWAERTGEGLHAAGTAWAQGRGRKECMFPMFPQCSPVGRSGWLVQWFLNNLPQDHWEGCLETGCWAPSPAFLSQWIWSGGCKAHF